MFDPKLDLKLERNLDVTPAMVWMAWTQPEHLKHWFTPAPWSTVDCQIDLRPGGIFRTVMRSPEGEETVNLGCYLEVIPERKVVWSNLMEPGFRPTRHTSHLTFYFTASVEIAPSGAGTRYTATVMHKDAESRDKHDSMGFQQGWGTVIEQMVAHLKRR